MAIGQVLEHPMASGNSVSKRASVPSVQSRHASAADAARSSVASLERVRAGFAPGMYRVLLAHDLTGPSEIALVRAARLALERKGHLIILHVVDGKLPARVVEAQRAHARSHLEAEVRRWLGGCKLSWRIDIGVGEPAGAIAARARAHRVDLVVAGRHQRRAAPSTVGLLLQQTERPMLIVGNPNQSPYRRVLVPIDLTDVSAARLQFAATLFPEASLHLLHAYKGRLQGYLAPLSLHREHNRRKLYNGRQPEHAASHFVASLRLGDRRPILKVENGDTLALVKQELARQKTDLLVLGAQARPGMKYVPIGSGAEAAFASSRCDMLFLPLMDLPPQKDALPLSSRGLTHP
jgi:nucleotide-binding universal stress UspA family protein